MKPRHLTKNNRHGLWAVLWRYLLLGPILIPIGIAALCLVFAAVLTPYAYAALLLTSGHIATGALLFVAWTAVLWFSRSLFDKLFAGLEYATS